MNLCFFAKQNICFLNTVFSWTDRLKCKNEMWHCCQFACHRIIYLHDFKWWTTVTGRCKTAFQNVKLLQSLKQTYISENIFTYGTLFVAEKRSLEITSPKDRWPFHCGVKGTHKAKEIKVVKVSCILCFNNK